MQSLVQKRFFFIKQIVQFNETQLMFVLQRPFHREEFETALVDIHAYPLRLIHFPLASIVLSIIFLTASGLAGWVWVCNLFTAVGAFAGFFAFCFLIFFLGTLIAVIQRKQNSVIFDAGDFQIILWNNIPSKTVFETFVNNLQIAIQKAKEEKTNQALNALRKLRAENIINEWQYDEALKVINKGGVSSNISSGER